MASVNTGEEQIRIDNLKINYKIIGNGNLPIILLHGWSLNSEKYIETANQLFLKTKDYGLKTVIIIPDLPGFGKSDNPPEAWGVDEYTEFVKNFIYELLGHSVSKFYLDTECPSSGFEQKVILIGHSFGGRIAIKFAAKYPEKLKALILTGAAGIKHQPSIKQKIFFIIAKAGKFIFSLPLINQLEKPAQKLLYKAAREKDYYAAKGVMKEVFKKVIDEDLTDCLSEIQIPTLLIWGKNDHSTPLSDAYIIKEKISAFSGSAGGGENCDLKIIGEANHSLPYQFPEKFAKIVAGFIKKTDEG